MSEYEYQLNDPSVDQSTLSAHILQDFCYTFNLLACRFDNLDIEHVHPETFDYSVVANALMLIEAYIIVPTPESLNNPFMDTSFYSPAYTYILYSRCCELLNML